MDDGTGSENSPRYVVGSASRPPETLCEIVHLESDQITGVQDLRRTRRCNPFIYLSMFDITSTHESTLSKSNASEAALHLILTGSPWVEGGVSLR